MPSDRGNRSPRTPWTPPLRCSARPWAVAERGPRREAGTGHAPRNRVRGHPQPYRRRCFSRRPPSLTCLLEGRQSPGVRQRSPHSARRVIITLRVVSRDLLGGKATRMHGRGPTDSSLTVGSEVLGRDLVEELAELRHLVLLLVRHRDPLVVQHTVDAVDGRTGAQRQCYGVGRPGAHAAAAGEDELRVEDALPQIRDPGLGELLADRFEYVLEEVVRLRPRR